MTTATQYVPTKAIKSAASGRERDILRALGIQWDARSKHVRCPYRDHDDEHASWRWNDAESRAHCTCTASASLIDVVSKVRGIDFEAAKLWMAEALGRSDLVRRLRCEGRGRNTQGNNTATAQHSGGCTLAGYAAAKRVPVGFLRALGLADVFYLGKPALKIPYFDTNGAEAAVRFRLALDGKEKFRWRKGSKARLYGLNRLAAARELGEIVIVEGESDCHTLWHAGLPAIGLPGAGNWNEQRDAALFDKFGTIYGIIEPDKGGETVRKWVGDSKIRDRVKLVRLNGFKDPSALYLDDPDHFAGRWKAALAAAVPWSEEASLEAEAARKAALHVCGELARCTNILSKVVETLRGYGLVGEERAVKLIYLAVSSRVLTRIVSIAVKGPSSGGKSFLVEIALKLFPPETFCVLTAMSEHALAYGEEALAHRILVLYEAAGLTGDFGTYLVRSLLSEGRICYDTVEKTKDGLKSRRIEREGPTGLITTTTAVHLHPENETRLLSLTVTDTPAQTKAVMQAQAKGQGRTDHIDLAPWHALQRFLALVPRQVVIPFASELADLIPAVAVRLRRDFPTILALIEAHALLHQLSRGRNPQGAIIATLEDYGVVREMVTDLISHCVGATVPTTVRETVATVGKLAEAGCDGVPLTRVAQKLKLDKSTASRRVTDAITRGHLKNLEEKKGRPARYVIADPLPDDVELLPAVEKLQVKCCSVAPLREGVEPSPSTMSDNEEEAAWTL